jgi:hypothetical protein
MKICEFCEIKTAVNVCFITAREHKTQGMALCESCTKDALGDSEFNVEAIMGVE